MSMCLEGWVLILNHVYVFRRVDTDNKLSKLMEQEKQLLALLAREDELSPEQKEQLLQQLEIWEQNRKMLEQEKKMQEKV